MAGDLASALGPLPVGWRLVRLAELSTHIGSGATPRGGSAVYLERRLQYALVRSQNVFDRRFSVDDLAFITDADATALRNVELEAGDVLLNITGDGVTFARSCLIPDRVLPACVNQHVVRIRCDTAKCSPGYLLSFLTHPISKHYIESFNAGGSRRAITKGHIESFLIPLPPLREQQAIACILGALDDKIELNRRTNRTLESIARAIFKSWFVDFDPVHAKAAGQSHPGLAPHLAALFPDAFETSELGEIPKGWVVSSVGAHFRLTMGQSPPGSTYNEIGEGLPFYQGRTDFGFRFPTRRVFCTEPTRYADACDTLVSVRAPVGDVNIASERCAIGRGVASVRHHSGSRSFTYHAMHDLGDHFANFEAEGTVFGSINKSAFEKLPIVAPAADVLSAFDQLVSPVDDQIEVYERESVTLAALRDALLPKLISGELRVPDAERIVGRAV